MKMLQVTNDWTVWGEYYSDEKNKAVDMMKHLNRTYNNGYYIKAVYKEPEGKNRLRFRKTLCKAW